MTTPAIVIAALSVAAAISFALHTPGRCPRISFMGWGPIPARELLLQGVYLGLLRGIRLLTID